jgi:predicted nucleic acid-binding protein
MSYISYDSRTSHQCATDRRRRRQSRRHAQPHGEEYDANRRRGLTETCHLLVHRLSEGAAIAFIRSGTLGAFQIFALDHSHLPRVEQLMTKYQDLPMDLADASQVILAEELGSGRILSTDKREFGAYRWKNRKPFRNLLSD